MFIHTDTVRTLLVFTWLACHSPFACAEGQLDSLEQLGIELEELQREFEIPAMAVLLVNSDRNIFFRVSGVADIETGRLADENTVFRIGSITKMFTALAILKLAEDSLISLQEPVSALLPERLFLNHWQDTHPVRVAHLLEHTSGLPGMSKMEMDYNQPLAIDRALELDAERRETLWPPGHHHSYSNTNSGLAELIIEKVSKQKYEAFLKSRLFEPLGMRSASLSDDRQTIAQLARGYDSDGQSPLPYWHMIFRGFGAINIRPADMSPFLRLLLQGGKLGDRRFFSENSISRMETPRTSLSARSDLQFGYGLGNYSWLRNGWIFRGHGGDADGYLSRLGYSRELDLGYFLVINTYKYNALQEIRHLIEDFISGARQRSEATPYPMSRSELQALTGEYRHATYRFQSAARNTSPVKVSLKMRKLLLNVGKNQYFLVPVSARHFRDEGESVATSAFVKDETGRLYLQHPQGNFLRITGPLQEHDDK